MCRSDAPPWPAQTAPIWPATAAAKERWAEIHCAKQQARRKMLPARLRRALTPADRHLFRYAYQTRRYSRRVGYFPRNLSIRGDRSEPRGFLASLRPVNRCAICRNISVVRWLAEISAIIWPLLAAEPNICGSKGIAAIGWLSIALAKSPPLISGRFGTPTWLKQ